MPNTDELQLRVALKNEVSAPLRQIADEIKGVANEIKGLNAPAQSAGSSVRNMAVAFTAGNLAAKAIQSALAFVRDELRASTEAITQYTDAMMGLSSIAGAFGESQDEARQAAMSLASDGLLTVTEAAAGLKNLLASEFNFSLEQAVELMEGFKDSAAFNRQGTLEYGQAIVGATTGIKNLNSIMVDNAGLTTNLSIITRRAGVELRDVGSATGDSAKQVELFNELMRELAIFEGDSARMADTLSGAQSRVRQETFELHKTIGSALQPALVMWRNTQADLASDLRRTLSPAMEGLAKTLAKVVTAIRAFILIGKTFIQTIAGIGEIFLTASRAAQTFWEALRGGNIGEAISAVNQGLEDLKFTAEGFKMIFTEDFATEWDRIGLELGQTLNKIEDQGLDVSNVMRDAVSRVRNTVDEEAKKIADSLAKAFRDFTKTMSRLSANFKQNLKDLVIAHREKTGEIKEQLKEENEDFTERMRERKDSFDKTMTDMIESHEDKVESIKKQQEDEKNKILEEQEEMERKYSENIIQFKDLMRDRLNSLTAQLDKEVAKGDLADKEKISNLKYYIEREKKSLEEQLARKEQMVEDEKEAIFEAHAERLEEIQDRLDEENADFLEAKEERISEYEKETAKLQNEYEKRINALDDQLSEELELQKRYAKDFEKFKDAQAESDIARLKRVYEEEKKMAKQSYSERVSDVTGGGAAGSYSLTEYFGGKDTEGYKKYKSGQKAGRWSDLPDYIAKGGTPTGFAQGGIVSQPTVSMIGEEGPEAVIPLTKPRRAREILKDAGLAGVTINAPITVVSSEVDIDMLLERIAFKLNKGGLV